MDYKEALSKIEVLREYGSQPGLERVKMLLECMGNPQDKLRFVHITGTNGKGSVCAVVSSVLNCSGYTTGLFTSPFIVDLREQIQVDNTMISEDEFAQVADFVFLFVDKLMEKGVIITEFEFTMAVAFEYFLRKHCDVVVLEVGMGGLLDSTNVIKSPLCAVLTPVSLDHTGMLGSTLTEIAQHKCGIIKEGTQVVSAIQTAQVQRVLEEVCTDINVPYVYADAESVQVLSQELSGTMVLYKGEEFTLPLMGLHQVQNLSISLCVLEALRKKSFDNITADSMREGIKSAKNPARFEVVGEHPTVIIDGAHNPEGMRTFADTLHNLFLDKKGVIVMGMLRDKDICTSLEFINGMFESVYTVNINNPRAMDARKLAEICSAYFDYAEACEDAECAFLQAYDKAKAQDTYLCVCGSLYLASQIRPYILKTIQSRGEDRISDN
ncbi:MAG: bifunctional folylpolyglutamate synthase/dihydrofolate synthase [Ruminococcus sp.]|nr:bifunctional folylpolyglutamate synthase/dihydrofolate synthase [Ruminococcus sp.]